VPRPTSTDLRITLAAWLLVSVVVLGALGMIVLQLEWAGLCAGLTGLVVTLLVLRSTRVVGFLAPLGLFIGLTLMEAWQLWRLRGDDEAMDPLVMMGIFAGLGGLFVGGILANLLDARPVEPEDD
jgi:hypothetical protein